MEERQTPYVWDYAVFGLMILSSLLLGLWKKGNKNGASSLIHGGGDMPTIPVALSMLASFLSSITLLGQPAEVYLFGPQQWLFGISFVFVIPVVGYYMVPMFRRKNYTSAYQYFGERFNKKVQFITSLFFTVSTLAYMSLVLYAPAMAVNQVTGINTMAMVTFMYAVCIIYTSVGGISAVVWTDAFQIIVTYISFFIILIKGAINAGGVEEIWNKNLAHNRTEFLNFSYDFTEQYTFWSVLFGLGFFNVAMTGANQFQVQRFTLVSSSYEVRKMLWVSVLGWTIIVFMTTFTGMLIFSVYSDCDPIASKRISRADQLFPLYIMENLQTPGILGLFLSGIFSAGLSTVSTGINSLAAIWYVELEGWFDKFSSLKSSRQVKCLAAFMGVLSYLPVFVLPYLGGLVPLAISFTSIFCGSLFAVFMLGMLTDIAEEWGALSGLLTSCVLFASLQLGSSSAAKDGYIIHDVLNASTANCSISADYLTQLNHMPVQRHFAPWYLRISHTWYCLLSALLTYSTGLIISFIVRRFETVKKKKTDVLLEPCH